MAKKPDSEHLKAVRDGYDPPPFFFEQVNAADEVRVVAWSGKLDQIRATVQRLLAQLPQQVEILLKVIGEDSPRTGQIDAGQCWTRYFGTVSRGTLVEAIAACDAFVFRDSRNQLCVRDPETSE